MSAIRYMLKLNDNQEMISFITKSSNKSLIINSKHIMYMVWSTPLPLLPSFQFNLFFN